MIRRPPGAPTTLAMVRRRAARTWPAERVVDGLTIRIAMPARLMIPDVGVTKGEMVEYYHRVAELLLPHLAGRPVTVRRFPDGIGGEPSYLRDAPDYFPPWIRRVPVERAGAAGLQVIVEREATIVYLAAQACLTPQPWLGRAEHLHRPDRLIFDLDSPPESSDFTLIRSTALLLRDLLEHLGLAAYPLLSGSRGLHVQVPILPEDDFEEVRPVARDIARVLCAQNPGQLTTRSRLFRAEHRLLVDTARNAFAQTFVPPYVLRARAGAPIATPVGWEELREPKMRADRYNIRNIFRRLARKSDPWEDMPRSAHSLSTARALLPALLDSLGLTPSTARSAPRSHPDSPPAPS